MIKKYLKWGLGTVFLILLFLVLKTLYVGGVFKTINNYNAGETTHIYTNVWGAEDLAIDTKHALLFISSSDRWAHMLRNENPLEDGIYALDLTDSLNTAPKKMLITYNGDFHPHGLSVVQQDSSTYVFVVNHNTKGDFIEQFKYQDGALLHLKSYANDLLFSPNDVAAVSDSTFYVTNDHGTKKGSTSRLLEDYLQQGKSYVLYFDGQQYTKVVEGLKYANGVALSNDKKTLYVAEATGQKITVYTILDNGALTLTHSIKMHTGVDNITVDAVGDLWIGAHAQLLKFTGHAKEATKLSPSEVLHMQLQDDGTYKTTQVYLNDGSEISGSSVALRYKDKLFIGGVFEQKLVQITLAPKK